MLTSGLIRACSNIRLQMEHRADVDNSMKVYEVFL